MGDVAMSIARYVTPNLLVIVTEVLELKRLCKCSIYHVSSLW